MASAYATRQATVATSTSMLAANVATLSNAFYARLVAELDAQAMKRVIHPANLVVSVYPSSIEGFDMACCGADTLTTAANSITSGFVSYLTSNGYPSARYSGRGSLSETISLDANCVASNYLSFTINI
jgi:hypothetical protein